MVDPKVVIAYVLNMLAGSAAMMAFIYYMKIQNDSLAKFPKSLKYFLLTSPFLFSIIMAAGSVYFSIHFLIFQDETTFIFKVLRFTVAVTAQHIRGSLSLIVIERILSTIFLEKYGKYASGYTAFGILTFITYLTTLLYVAPSIIWIFVPGLEFVYYILLYLNFFVHGFTLIMAHILHRRNRHLYKLLAYRVTLKRRYQILENIQVLSFLWPTILLFSTVAPIGIILTIIYAAVFQSLAPTCLFLIMYNTAFTLVLVVRIRENLKRQRTFSTETTESRNEKKIVKSPLGRILPTSVSPENYFKGLKQQWA